MNRYFLLFGAFLLLVILLGIGLTLNPRDIPSALIAKPAPDFRLPVLNDARAFSPAEMKGKIWLLNVWASWCVSCRVEHSVLVEFAKNNGNIPIIGLNYKEIRGDATIDSSKISPKDEKIQATTRANAWLLERGNPYTLSVLDLNGRVGIDYGVYGVPETFLIDANNTIRFKHLGPITADVLKDKILPAIAELQNAS